MKKNIVARSTFHCFNWRLWRFAGRTQALLHPKTRRHDFVNSLSGPMPFGNAVPDLFALGLDFVEQLLLVEAEILAVIDQRFAVDDNRAHVAAHRSFHERADRITHRAEGDVSQVDDRDVSLGASLQPA